MTNFFIHNLKEVEETRRYLRQNMTLEEKILWYSLKNKSLTYKFRRQHSIGNFIVDFYCPLRRLVIELDGNQHLDNKEYDKERSEYFKSLDIRVIRFWNKEITSNLENVLSRIKYELNI